MFSKIGLCYVKKLKLGSKLMESIVALVVVLVVVLVTLLLPFLDKIIEYFYPEGSLSSSENEVDKVLNESDCVRVHRIIE